MSDTIVKTFDPARVRPLPDQPRKRFRGIRELADSIEEIGQSCPGIVTLVDGDPDFDAQLVDGERRLRACRMAGVRFRAEVRDEAGAEDMFVAAFGANFGKQNHDVLEISAALDRMQKAGKTIEQMARIAGKSVCWVSQHLSLRNLHPEVAAMMVNHADDDDEAPTLSYTIGMTLAGLDEPLQLTIARKVAKAKAGSGMSLSAVRRLVARERNEAGDKRAYNKANGSRRSINTIETIVIDLSERIGVYLDMPGGEINRVIDSADHLTKRNVIKSIRETCESLESLAEAIESRLPVTSHRTN